MLLLSEWLLSANAQTVNRVIMLGFLGAFAVMDITKRKLPVIILAISVVLALCLRLVGERTLFAEVLAGLLPGLLLFITAYFTHGQIGYADVWVISFTGILGGLKTAVVSLLLASIAAAVFSLVLCVAKKVSKKYEVPFIPFIAAATAAVVYL